MRFNENEYCIEMNAEELCSMIARPSDLDSRPIQKMNIQSKTFDAFLCQLPDYDRAHEPLRQLDCVHNTMQINGTYYTISSVIDRAYKCDDMGDVDLFVERRFMDEGAIPTNYDIALLKINSYFYASKHSVSRVNMRIVFCFRESKKIKIIEDNYTIDALRKEYISLLERADFFGKLMLVNLLQPANVSRCILVMPSGIVIPVKFLQR